MEPTAVEHHFIKTNGITLHVVSAGPEDGSPVFLLHGFPEYWAGWRRQIPVLAAAGFRVWAPDQRGYNLSDKPQDVESYVLDTLADDIIGLFDALKLERANLVGHDWGAAVSWWLGMRDPERLRHLGILNVPHPAVMSRHARTNLRQLTRSWYFGFFQLPWLPERMSSAFNWSGLERSFRRSAPPGLFSDVEIADYKRAWSQPGAYTAMVNWYRAALRHQPEAWPSPVVSPPTTIIWGTDDIALGEEMVAPSADLCADVEVFMLEGVSHWVQHQAAERVNEILLSRLPR
jgi:pimeloyl-ACP methyl ester carboxylesterase